MTQNRHQVKTKTCQKQSRKNQIDPKTNYKISYQKISMKHLEQIMFNQISNLILRRTSCWNNITNKNYWPKTGIKSKLKRVKSNLENQIDPKTNNKISYQTISMKHLEQIMFNQISKLIPIPIEKNFLLKQHNK